MSRHHLPQLIAAKCPPEIIVRGFSSPDELQDCKLRLTGRRLWTRRTGPGNCRTALLDLIAQLPRSRRHRCGCPESHRQTRKTGHFERQPRAHAPSGGIQAAGPGSCRIAPRMPPPARLRTAFPPPCCSKGAGPSSPSQDQPLWCNATGSPGMATGGQGDLLAGVIGARLASGDAPARSRRPVRLALRPRRRNRAHRARNLGRITDAMRCRPLPRRRVSRLAMRPEMKKPMAPVRKPLA